MDKFKVFLATFLLTTAIGVTAQVSIHDMTDTWDDAGTTFNAIKMDVTDTASQADSLLLELQVDSVSQFNVGKTGQITTSLYTFPAADGGASEFLQTNGAGVLSWAAVSGGAFTADGDTQITPATPIVLDHATNNEIALNIDYTVNKAAGNDTGLKINMTDTASPGTSYLIDLQADSSPVFQIAPDGGMSGLILRTKLSDNNYFYGSNAMAGVGSGADYNVAIGSNAGASNGAGDRNILIGHNVLDDDPDPSDVVAIGYGAGDGASSINYGVAIGTDALGGSASDAPNNVAVGYQAGLVVTTANDAVMLGYQAGDTLSTGDFSILIGSGADALASDDAYAIAIGYQATADSNAIAIGDAASAVGISIGDSAETWEADSIAIGLRALDASGATATDNIAIGTDALGANVSTDENVAVGHEALKIATSGPNTAIGYRAMYAATGSNGTVAIGHQAGDELTVGDNNTFVGSQAGHTTTTGASNTIVGGGSVILSSRSYGVLVGASAIAETGSVAIGYDTNVGDYGIGIGYRVGLSVGVPDDNIEISNDSPANSEPILEGRMSARSDVDISGSNLTLRGPSADAGAVTNLDGGTLTLSGGLGASGSAGDADGGDLILQPGTGYGTGDDGGVVIDYSTWPAADGGASEFLQTNGAGVLSWAAVSGGFTSFVDDETNENYAIGEAALDSLAGGSRNIALGTNAGTALATANDTIAIGYNAGLNHTAGSDQVFIGSYSGDGTVGASSTGNVGVGSRALSGNLSGGNNNVGVGRDALLAVTSGSGNVGVGYGALDSVTTTSNNVAVGQGALDNTTGTGNVGVGWSAGDNVYSAGYNTLVGYNADVLATGDTYGVAIGANTITDSDSVAIGRGAIAYSNSIAIGAYALDTITSGTDNVAIGWNAGTALSNGSDNILIGDQVAGAMDSGNKNIVIGTAAGALLESGIANVAIGYAARPTAAGTRDSVVIGELAEGDSYSVVIGAGAHTGATSGGQQNTVIGYGAAVSLTTSDESIVIGSQVDGLSATEHRQIVIGNNVISGYQEALSDTDWSGKTLTITGPSALPAAATNQDGGNLILRGGQNATAGGSDGFALVDDTVYGIMSVQGGVTSQDDIGTTPEILVAWNTDGISNGTTVSSANDYITADVAGVYEVIVNVSFTGTNSADVTMEIQIYDDSGTSWSASGFAFERTLGAAAATGSAGVSGLVTLDTSDRVALYISTGSATDDVTVSEAQLQIKRISD